MMKLYIARAFHEPARPQAQRERSTFCTTLGLPGNILFKLRLVFHNVQQLAERAQSHHGGNRRLIETVVKVERYDAGMCESHVNDTVREEPAFQAKKVASSLQGLNC